ncbi:CDP-archaeol synthase [Oleisolibacter albus]|uniref:CDP-archaeol synthase n=1 Tax=Oleisolibacter albus TaxID=2171757 RepID=UPI000DF494AF|nr:CDP-archaeol synthase [Oleisolibacter albus]
MADTLVQNGVAHTLFLLQILLLLGLANGAPILAAKFMGETLAYPVDGGCRFGDGRRLFGPAKTVRGLVAGTAAAAGAAPLLGLDVLTGALLGIGSLCGDLVSSFIKRRLGLPPHGRALGLDYIPEALLPLALLRPALGLSWIDVGLLVVAFAIVDFTLSRLLFRIRLRDRPY